MVKFLLLVIPKVQEPRTFCSSLVRWDCYRSVFTNLQHDYGPCSLSEFRFRSLSHKRIDGIFIVKIWLSKFRFRSISSERIDVIRLNFTYALALIRSRLGLLRVDFRKFTTVMALDYCQNFFHT